MKILNLNLLVKEILAEIEISEVLHGTIYVPNEILKKFLNEWLKNPFFDVDFISKEDFFLFCNQRGGIKEALKTDLPIEKVENFEGLEDVIALKKFYKETEEIEQKTKKRFKDELSDK